MTQSVDLGAAISAAVRAVDRALAHDMKAQDGTPAAPHLEQLRNDLLVIRARGAVDANDLRRMIRSVAAWAPEDDVTLLSALGALARARA
jgi:hypothetical protein